MGSCPEVVRRSRVLPLTAVATMLTCTLGLSGCVAVSSTDSSAIVLLSGQASVARDGFARAFDGWQPDSSFDMSYYHPYDLRDSAANEGAQDPPTTLSRATTMSKLVCSSPFGSMVPGSPTASICM